ncbi:hypothetical protein BGX29_005634 [Mortierella sp. GBA35]|nr:hypothetical protein BGX29_005634 [Mortierella sp. GBA35]
MTRANDTFFALPELIACLAPFLTTQDLIRLTRTNHNLNTICTPFLWTSLDLFSSHNIATRLLASSEGLQAFRDNVDTIRAVHWKLNFAWYYFNALLAHLNNHNHSAPVGQEVGNNKEAIISTDALTHADWGRMETPSPFPVEPLPRLCRLSFYKARMDYVTYGRNISDLLPGYHRHPHHHQTFWFLRLNSSTLVHLELLGLELHSWRRLWDLCRTIAGLCHLRILRLDTEAHTQIACKMFETVFFSCPASLVELIFRPFPYASTPQKSEVWHKLQDRASDFGHGPLVVRTEPLRQLRILGIPHCYSGYETPSLCSILEQCPALESLCIPALGNAVASQRVAERIATHCLRLKDLLMPEPGLDFEGVAVMSVMETIPAQQLRKLLLRRYLDRHPDRMKAAWARHSETLHTIELVDCRWLKSSTFRTILINCPALERLEVTRLYTSECFILLEDAVSEKWASTRIRFLSISVKLPDDVRDSRYLVDPSMESWTDQDHTHWEMLGKFYTQIGSLAELEYLDLRSTAMVPSPSDSDSDEEESDGYSSDSEVFPMHKPIYGPVAEVMGERELEWFVDHLPALELATFLCDNTSDDSDDTSDDSHDSDDDDYRNGLPELLQALQNRRPGLRISSNKAEEVAKPDVYGWD